MEDKIINYFEGKLSYMETVELLREVESDPASKDLFINIQNTRTLIGMIPEMRDEPAAKVGYGQFRQITLRKATRRIAAKVFAYAASIALLITATWHVAGSWGLSTKTTEVYVPTGQRAKLTLDDGSVVWLNARSTLTYPSVFSSNRHVTLTGEAFFDVATDPDRPFTVTTQGVNITALGTKFNVAGYPENGGVQTSLLEGLVKVWDDRGAEVVLQPNQQARYSDRRFILESIEHSDYFLWTRGVYSFVNEPLTSVIQKLERYYNVKIEVANPAMFNYEFTGKFRQQDGVDMILRIIQRIHPFEFERKEDIIILKN
jgi:ferric-dicitrate binding protein FerR (iron transport regulator)